MYLENVKIKNKFYSKLTKLLSKFNYKIILFNRSLLCADKVELLSHDNYDDFLIDKKILRNPKLLNTINKFYNFKFDKNALTIFYDKFEANLILIDFNTTNFNFNGFIIKVADLKKIKKIKILNKLYFAPKYPKKVFNKIFSPKHSEIFFSPLLSRNKNIILRLKNFVLCFLYIFLFSKKYSRYELNFRILNLYRLNPSNFIIAIINKFKKRKIFKLQENKFRKLKFDPDEFNWYFRDNHYRLITQNLKYIKVDDIIKFLHKKKLGIISRQVVDTTITKPVAEPIYLNKRFWKTGNNFYINPILFGFKKGVLAYEKVNYYLKLKKKPQIYTKAYYKKLENMNEFEIKKTLFKSPVEINNYGFLSGRHRVAAMIGRLIRGEKYLPFYVYKSKI